MSAIARAKVNCLIMGICGALALGAAWGIASVEPAFAWGAAGGGGAKKPPQIDPEKIKKLRYLTKLLKAELSHDNQKSADVRAKEGDQAHEMTQIILSLPPDNPDGLEAADMVLQYAKVFAAHM